MNQARARQVLDDIADSVERLESEAERLALLIAEVKREGYWRLRFKTEEEWIKTTFGERSLRRIRQLAAIGESFKDMPEVISEIGISKADIIQNAMKLDPAWVEKAKNESYRELRRQLRTVLVCVKTEQGARKLLHPEFIGK